ncbi:MAG: L-ribulose-5-phosphate 3-epimerase [Erysipelotrichaceae bacterium]|nr:L-ribulose-5-phosphate 3-epimerase [Erysipelotrichaceae bacterium]
MKNLLGIYEKALPIEVSWRERFELAKKAGFDFIEVSVDKSRLNKLDWTDEEIKEMLDLAEEFGMPYHTLTLSANRYWPIGDNKLRDEGIKLIKKAIVLAKKMNIEIIQLAAYDVYGKESTEESARLYKEALLEVLEFNKDYNIVLAIEVLEDCNLYNTSEKLVALIKDINSPYLKEYADNGNLIYNGYDPVEDLKACKDEIVALHVKDAIFHNEHNIEYGHGEVDFEGVFKYLKEIDYQGILVSECWYEEDFHPDLEYVNNFIRRYMQ